MISSLKNIYTFFCVSAIMFLFAGCEKAPVSFDLNYSSQITVGPGTSVSVPVSIVSPPIQTNSSAFFSSNNTRADLVQSVTLKKLHLSIKSPTGADFTFLKSVEIFILANELAEARIAHKLDVPDMVGSELEMDIDGAELKEYLKQESFKLRTVVTTDKAIAQSITVEVAATFNVKAKVIN